MDFTYHIEIYLTKCKYIFTDAESECGSRIPSHIFSDEEAETTVVVKKVPKKKPVSRRSHGSTSSSDGGFESSEDGKSNRGRKHGQCKYD